MYGGNLMIGERNKADGGVCKHPLHQSEDVVFADQSFENSQIE